MFKIKQHFSFLISVITLVALFAFMVGCGQQQAEIEKQKEIARLVTEEAWNKGNVDILDEYYASTVVWHQPPHPDFQGLDVLKQVIKDVRSEYPDWRISIEDILVVGDKVIIQGTVQATQTGIHPELGFATGKKINVEYCTVSRIVDNKTSEINLYCDVLGWNQQLGYKLSPPLSENTFARVTLTQMNPDKMEEAVKIYQESVVPDAQSQNGYRGVYLLSDFKTGKGISIAIWDTEEDAIANEQSGYYKKQVDRFKDLMTAPPIREGYLVTVQE